MRVIYTDPNGLAGTYHPELGYLESGKSFELPEDVAEKYLKLDLLKKSESKKLKAEEKAEEKFDQSLLNALGRGGKNEQKNKK